MNLCPPSVAVSTHTAAPNAVAFQSPTMPNARMSLCPQSVYYFSFPPRPLRTASSRFPAPPIRTMSAAIGVEFDTFAGSLPRLTSLHMTWVPGFHQMTPRATPTTAVFLKLYASLGSMIANCLYWGIEPTAYPPTVWRCRRCSSRHPILACFRPPTPRCGIGMSCGLHRRRSVHVSLLDWR